jgi:type I restriction enzyme S subunit
MDTPDTTYELYSVPSWENKYPEIVEGKDIGSTKQSVSRNDVLLCKINPRINRVWVVGQYSENPLIASSEWIVIRNKQLFSKYLYYYLQSPQFRDMLISEQAGIGGSLTRAQPKRVATYPVLIPPLDVQQKIAVVLDKASALIELRRAQLDKLDLLIKSQFIEMFGAPATNIKRWPIVLLKDLFNVRSSKRVYQGEQTTQGVPFLRVSDLVQKINGSEASCNLYISNEQYNDFLRSSLVPDSQKILSK